MLSTRRNVWIAASAKPIIMSDMYDKDAAAHTYDTLGKKASSFTTPVRKVW